MTTIWEIIEIKSYQLGRSKSFTYLLQDTSNTDTKKTIDYSALHQKLRDVDVSSNGQTAIQKLKVGNFLKKGKLNDDKYMIVDKNGKPMNGGKKTTKKPVKKPVKKTSTKKSTTTKKPVKKPVKKTSTKKSTTTKKPVKKPVKKTSTKKSTTTKKPVKKPVKKTSTKKTTTTKKPVKKPVKKTTKKTTTKK